MTIEFLMGLIIGAGVGYVIGFWTGVKWQRRQEAKK